MQSVTYGFRRWNKYIHNILRKVGFFRNDLLIQSEKTLGIDKLREAHNTTAWCFDTLHI